MKVFWTHLFSARDSDCFRANPGDVPEPEDEAAAAVARSFAAIFW